MRVAALVVLKSWIFEVLIEGTVESKNLFSEI